MDQTSAQVAAHDAALARPPDPAGPDSAFDVDVLSAGLATLAMPLLWEGDQG